MAEDMVSLFSKIIEDEIRYDMDMSVIEILTGDSPRMRYQRELEIYNQNKIRIAIWKNIKQDANDD